MAKKKGVVAFDFDGVIGDSVFECFVQSVKAFNDLGGKTKQDRRTERAFREARPLITKAEHFFTVMRLIQENPGIKFGKMSQANFEAALKADANNLGRFSKRFYEHREEMKQVSRAEWIKLQKSFPKAAKLVAAAQKGNQVFIATTKDKKSVAELLAAYGIKIPESHILAKEFSKDKKDQLREIARIAGVEPRQIVLVEDAVKQIRDVRQIGVKGVLVRWGYSTKGQRKVARKKGVPQIRKAGVLGRGKLKRIARRTGK